MAPRPHDRRYPAPLPGQDRCGRVEGRPGPAAGGRTAATAAQPPEGLRTQHTAQGAHRPVRLGPRDDEGGTGAGALPLRRGRARQVDADGPVLRLGRGGGETPGPLPCLHAGGPCRDPCRAQDRSRGPDPARGRRYRRRRGVALLRRNADHRYHGCHDRGPPVRTHAGTRRGDGGDLEPAPRRPLQGRAEPAPLRPLHRDDQDPAGSARTGRARGSPAGPAARGGDLPRTPGRAGRRRPGCRLGGTRRRPGRAARAAEAGARGCDPRNT